MNVDGSGVQRVTSGRAFEESPTFFPDGQRIAFARYTRNDADIFTKTIGVPGSTRVTNQHPRVRGVGRCLPQRHQDRLHEVQQERGKLGRLPH